MGKRNITTKRKVVGLPAFAQDSLAQITMRVDGFSCPIGTYDLEKKLNLLVVLKVRHEIQQGVAEVTATKGKAIEESQVWQVVFNAGVRPRESPTAPKKVPAPLEI